MYFSNTNNKLKAGEFDKAIIEGKEHAMEFAKKVVTFAGTVAAGSAKNEVTNLIKSGLLEYYRRGGLTEPTVKVCELPDQNFDILVHITGKGYYRPEDTRYETASGDKQEEAQKGFQEAAQGVIDACNAITKKGGRNGN